MESRSVNSRAKALLIIVLVLGIVTGLTILMPWSNGFDREGRYFTSTREPGVARPLGAAAMTALIVVITLSALILSQGDKEKRNDRLMTTEKVWLFVAAFAAFALAVLTFFFELPGQGVFSPERYSPTQIAFVVLASLTAIGAMILLFIGIGSRAALTPADGTHPVRSGTPSYKKGMTWPAKCPYCRESIERGAASCRHCRSDLRRPLPQWMVETSSSVSSTAGIGGRERSATWYPSGTGETRSIPVRFCGRCGRPTSQGSKYCACCGFQLPATVEIAPAAEQPCVDDPNLTQG